MSYLFCCAYRRWGSYNPNWCWVTAAEEGKDSLPIQDTKDSALANRTGRWESLAYRRRCQPSTKPAHSTGSAPFGPPDCEGLGWLMTPTSRNDKITHSSCLNKPNFFEARKMTKPGKLNIFPDRKRINKTKKSRSKSGVRVPRASEAREWICRNLWQWLAQREPVKRTESVLKRRPRGRSHPRRREGSSRRGCVSRTLYRTHAVFVSLLSHQFSFCQDLF